MAKPKEVLSPADYKNYRNVRLVAVVFSTEGILLLLLPLAVIIVMAIGMIFGPREQFDPAAVIGIVGVMGPIAAFGLAGAVGGIATLRGSRRWAPLAYVWAAVHLICFPIGTILGYVMLTGLSRHLDSVERIRNAARQDA